MRCPRARWAPSLRGDAPRPRGGHHLGGSLRPMLGPRAAAVILTLLVLTTSVIGKIPGMMYAQWLSCGCGGMSCATASLRVGPLPGFWSRDFVRTSRFLSMTRASRLSFLPEVSLSSCLSDCIAISNTQQFEVAQAHGVFPYDIS